MKFKFKKYENWFFSYQNLPFKWFEIKIGNYTCKCVPIKIENYTCNFSSLNRLK